MEFHEKLQALRKRKNITQEELAAHLYVSRTAVSKWESGRGYPNIDSLKAIANFFSVTVDELLSTDELLTIAQADTKSKEQAFRNWIYGAIDVSAVLLFFLPLFAQRTNEQLQSVPLITLHGVQPYLQIAYWSLVALTVIMGLLTLILRNSQAPIWLKYKTAISFSLNAIALLIFIISLQPYPAIFTFTLSAIKLFIGIKRQ